MKKKLLYFGCMREKGHYLWTDELNCCANRSALERSSGIAGVTDRFINTIDSTYSPHTTSQGAYMESIVPPFRIVCWNDYTIDSRPGSSSTFLGISYKSVSEMLVDARKLFPSVMSRQTVVPHLANGCVTIDVVIGRASLATSDREMVLGALDSLGVALANVGHVWTDGERAIYEQAVKIMGGSNGE